MFVCVCSVCVRARVCVRERERDHDVAGPRALVHVPVAEEVLALALPPAGPVNSTAFTNLKLAIKPCASPV
jgi:hypothetical protein